MPCQGKTLLIKSKMLQLLSMVPVTCGHGLPMALDGFIPFFSSAFRLTSRLVFLQLFQISKRNYQTPCTRLSMEVINWLASVMRFLTYRALHIASSFDPIVSANNERCLIIVSLVSVD